jgi:hypothetical protein
MIIKIMNLEQDELDVLLCITGIAHDFDDSEIVDDIVECLMSDTKGLPAEYGLSRSKKDVAVYVKKTLAKIIEKLGG